MPEFVPPPIFTGVDEGELLRYNHTYGTLLSHIGETINRGYHLGYWEPALLLRGVIDYKIKHPDEINDIPALVSDTTSVVTDTHRGALTPDRFEGFVESLGSYSSLRRSMVTQPRDRMTAAASQPKYSRLTAQRLTRHLGSADSLFIVLGHGGTTAGLVTYLDYTNSAGSDSVAYPVRFSTQKKKDARPQLQEKEVAHLRALASTLSRVVIFDEDCSSGETLKLASAFFDGLLDTETVPVANRTTNRTQHIVGLASLTKFKG